jgi:general secretion pathway protein K
MLILTLVATLAGAMVWQQRRALQVEGAERARAQAVLILSGALDWARLILREDLRSGGGGGAGRPPVDSLNEPWATPLAEARLSTFLAADKDNNTDGGPDAFLSGDIVDAQSRWNLRNLFDPAGKVVAAELAALDALCNQANVPAGTAQRIADGLRGAWVTANQSPDGSSGGLDALLPPSRLADLAWLGLQPAVIERLAPWVDVLPVATPVNVNTAPREVLAATIKGLDLGSAERLVQARLRKPFETVDDIRAQLAPGQLQDTSRVSVGSSWFLVSGRLRLDDRVLEERSLLERRGSEVLVVRRERLSLSAGAGAPPRRP